MKKDKVIISWKQFEQDIKELSKKIPRNKYAGIIAITKGGLIPAYYIADKLGIKTIETFCISSYDDQTRNVILVHKQAMTSEFPPNSWLIVDDLVDTGESVNVLKKEVSGAGVATLYTKETTKIIPDYSVREINSWVVFPWEK